ncbi:hypothetical protein B0H13DRAFT_2670098 [Mycena leptocephala]|nr:hypothetical protein B0H13DRAFT_2670098 [Mycena leptocephala]
MRRMPAHEEVRGDSSAPQTRSYRPTTSSRTRSFTSAPPSVRGRMVWMEVADEDEDAARTSCIPRSPTPSTWPPVKSSSPTLKAKAIEGAGGAQDERALSGHGRRPWSRWMGSGKWARPRMRSAHDEVAREVNDNTRNVDGKPGGGRGGA